jgi:hypothetical protein
MMKTLTLAAAAVIAITGAAAAVEMPAKVIGEWCHVDEGGVYVAAKRFCAKSRDVVFFVHSVGFHVRIKGEPALYLCVPQEVTATGNAWRVIAACGPNDNSGPVNQLSFTFKPDAGRLLISFGD